MSYKTKREGGRRGPPGDHRPRVNADQIALLECPCRGGDDLCFACYTTCQRLEREARRAKEI
jgi:hypothetical protein